VIPQVIQANSGRTAYNFAMAQAPAPASYFLLRRLLEEGGHPSAIVVDFKTSVLAGGPRFSLRHWQETLSLREVLDLTRETGNLGLFAEILLGRMLPSYRDRLEIREAIGSALRGEPAPTHATNRLALRNWGRNRGAHLNSARLIFGGDISPEIVKKLLPDRWKCHRVNEAYVNRLLALAESREIPVYWLIPPLPPQLQEVSEKAGVDKAFLAFVRSMQRKHPGVTVVDGRHSGYDPTTFADHTHLNARGASAMSHDLAAILTGSANASRWVVLPRFRECPLTVPAEDVDQSRIALDAEATRR